MLYCVDLWQSGYTVRYMSNCYDKDIIHTALQFKALATPVRLKIFKELTRCCLPGSDCDIQRCIGDLAELVDVAPSTLSHHMKALNEAGLVDMQRDGKRILCRVNTKNLTQLSNYFDFK